MKRKALLKHWEVIEAYKNGKRIQILHGPTWVNIDRPTFKKRHNYRVYPKEIGLLVTDKVIDHMSKQIFRDEKNFESLNIFREQVMPQCQPALLSNEELYNVMDIVDLGKKPINFSDPESMPEQGVLYLEVKRQEKYIEELKGQIEIYHQKTMDLIEAKERFVKAVTNYIQPKQSIL